MSTSSRTVGLGIHTRGAHDGPAELATVKQGQHSRAAKTADNRARQPRRTLTGPRAPRRQGRPPADLSLPQHHGVPDPTTPSGTLSSAASSSSHCQGEDEIASDRELRDLVTQGSQGRRSALEPTAESVHTTASKQLRRASTTDYHGALDRSRGSALPRDVTLLTFGGSHARSAAELKSLLGNSNARLKAGSVILPDHVRNSTDKKVQKEHGVALEQAKSRARVEVDIVLESNICVQGGFLRGHIKVRVRKRSKKEGPVLLSEGKIRVVGYESVMSEDENHTFYQCAAPLSAVTDASRNLYAADADNEGFAPAAEGLHVLPFALKLPIDNSFGVPKGVVNFSSGVSVRYIAMVSVKVKDVEREKKSIAHFYRHCEIWPYMDPTIVLQPASRPLQASTAKSLALIGNSSKVKLHAQMHRLYWPAGTRCPISFHVVNGSKKTIRNLTLTLVRTVTVFRPRPMLDTAVDRDPDSCQTATTHKVVAESVLEICAGVAKGHASAKGWWTGISPGCELDFVHYIPIPAEAFSITRARLFEVEYSIRVTISAGPLSPDVSVTLPIRIFNFLSIDPPPSAGLLSSSGAYIRPSNSLLSHTTEGPPMSMTGIAALASHNKLLSVSPEEQVPDDPPLPPYSHRTYSLRVTNPDASMSHLPALPSHGIIQSADSETSVYSTCSSASGSDVDEPRDGPPSHIGSSGKGNKVLGNLDLHEDADSDEEIKAVLGSARVDGGQFGRSLRTSARMTPRSTGNDTPLRVSRSQPGMRVSTLDGDGNTPRMEGVGSGMAATSFASRVQQKRRALAAAREPERTRANSSATGMHGKKSMSLFLPESSTDEDEETPRIGYPSLREESGYAGGGYMSSNGYSSTEPSSDYEGCPATNNEQTASRLLRKGSRTLPTPPAPMPSNLSLTNGIPVHGAASFSSSPEAMPTTNSRILPTPPRTSAAPATGIPPVPPIPAHILALCTQKSSRDSDPLRKAIIRPPRSPLRALARDSGTSSSSDGGSEVWNRIAALEHRVRSSQDGDFAYC